MKRVFPVAAFLLVVALASMFPPPMGVGSTQNTDAQERSKLAGTWRGYVVDGKGENPDRGPVHIEVVITADKIAARNLQDGGKSMGEGAYKLDPAKKLREIDATGAVFPAKKAKTYQGIYQIEGDTLKWCVDNKGQGRPTEFASQRGYYLLVLKRQKS